MCSRSVCSRSVCSRSVCSRSVAPQWRDIHALAATRHTPLDDTCRALIRPGVAYIPLAITELLWASEPPREELARQLVATYLQLQSPDPSTPLHDYVWPLGIGHVCGVVVRTGRQVVVWADAHLMDASPAARMLLSLVGEVTHLPRQFVHVSLPSLPGVAVQACVRALDDMQETFDAPTPCDVDWNGYLERGDDALPPGQKWIAANHLPNDLTGARRVVVHFQVHRDCLIAPLGPPIMHAVDCQPQTPLDLGCTFQLKNDKMIVDQQHVFPLGAPPFALAHASGDGKQRTLVSRDTFAHVAAVFREVCSGELCRATYADQQARLVPPQCACAGCPMWRAFRNLVTECPTTSDRVMLLNCDQAPLETLKEHLPLLRQLLRFADLDPLIHAPWIRRQLAAEEVRAFHPFVVRRSPGTRLFFRAPWVGMHLAHDLELTWTEDRLLVAHTHPVYTHDPAVNAWCLEHPQPYRLKVHPEQAEPYTLELHAFFMAASVPAEPFASRPAITATFGLALGSIELRVQDIRSARVRRIDVERDNETLTTLALSAG